MRRYVKALTECTLELEDCVQGDNIVNNGILCLEKIRRVHIFYQENGTETRQIIFF